MAWYCVREECPFKILYTAFKTKFLFPVLQPYQVTQGSSREWRIICQGYYPDVHVLDAGSLELLYTLSSKVAPDWISALCVIRPLKRQGMGVFYDFCS